MELTWLKQGTTHSTPRHGTVTPWAESRSQKEGFHKLCQGWRWRLRLLAGLVQVGGFDYQLFCQANVVCLSTEDAKRVEQRTAQGSNGAEWRSKWWWFHVGFHYLRLHEFKSFLPAALWDHNGRHQGEAGVELDKSPWKRGYLKIELHFNAESKCPKQRLDMEKYPGTANEYLYQKKSEHLRCGTDWKRRFWRPQSFLKQGGFSLEMSLEFSICSF